MLDRDLRGFPFRMKYGNSAMKEFYAFVLVISCVRIH